MHFGLLAAVLAVLVGSAVAAPAVAEDPARNTAPDVFHRLADWLDHSVKDMRDGLNDGVAAARRKADHTTQDIKGAAAAAGGRLDSLEHLHIQIVHERQRCPSAANGAPDCHRAAEAICHAHRFASGKSFEVQSEQKCSGAALLAHAPGACRNETYIVQSMCQ